MKSNISKTSIILFLSSSTRFIIDKVIVNVFKRNEIGRGTKFVPHDQNRYRGNKSPLDEEKIKYV